MHKRIQRRHPSRVQLQQRSIVEIHTACNPRFNIHSRNQTRVQLRTELRRRNALQASHAGVFGACVVVQGDSAWMRRPRVASTVESVADASGMRGGAVVYEDVISSMLCPRRVGRR